MLGRRRHDCAGSGVRVYLATQPCDMRKGMDGLAAQVQNVLAADGLLQIRAR
ncbi:IS66 family insertion sequence element accessory protein TnpB [Mesorhizobium caraganae]|uniref:IS66 family insertion sequence element accessory protein TnpB n=1 Tax=Mesorhizobium caraganae TaxID=483206 RepID=UPI0035E41109